MNTNPCVICKGKPFTLHWQGRWCLECITCGRLSPLRKTKREAVTLWNQLNPEKI
jgi:hypothetical protein